MPGCETGGHGEVNGVHESGCRHAPHEVKAVPAKHATYHAFRHSFATQRLGNDYDIRLVQKLPGRNNCAEIIMVYTNALNQGRTGVKNPADDL